MVLLATVGWEVSLVSQNMATFGWNFPTISSILLALTTIGVWVLYAIFAKNANEFVKVFVPIANSIFSLFTLSYIFNFSLNLVCPDADPDDCAGEAGFTLVIFLSTLFITSSILYCFYLCITGEINFRE